MALREELAEMESEGVPEAGRVLRKKNKVQNDWRIVFEGPMAVMSTEQTRLVRALEVKMQSSRFSMIVTEAHVWALLCVCGV